MRAQRPPVSVQNILAVGGDRCGADAACGAFVGTSNVSSLVGLGAALQLWLRIAPSARAHVTRLATLLKQGALAIDGVRCAEACIRAVF